MEVFFLDVGQGTSQVILLGGRRAIVIDCADRGDRSILRFLQRAGVDYLDLLIISHSHEDHIGGAISILGAYQNRIERIACVQDDKFLESAFWLRVSELLKQRKISHDQLVRLEVRDVPQVVWSDAAIKAQLLTYSPTYAQNLLAQTAGIPNATSAILFLDVNSRLVVFAADSEVDQWREIHSKRKARIRCDILSVPHHAGRSFSTASDLKWQFDHAIHAEVGIVSVGTSNWHGHPREDVIKAMTAHGAKVLCTQITRRCHKNLETLRPGVLQPIIHAGMSMATEDLTDAGNSRNVACAGTVRAIPTNAGFVVDRLDDHQNAVDSMAMTSHGCPLCRP